MVFLYRKELKLLASYNRRNPTKAESKIWNELLRNDGTGYRFNRQKPIDKYILDFYCDKLKLGIELDGKLHKENEEYDLLRSDNLADLGIIVVRYDNFEVLEKFEDVSLNLESIIKLMEKQKSL